MSSAQELEERERNQERFETELEFVQCLANPFYLSSLAQQGFLEQESFINYLNYLKYWSTPRFARYLQYPQALHHLALLTTSPAFRLALKSQVNLAHELAGKQLGHWAGFREEGGLRSAAEPKVKQEIIAASVGGGKE